MEKKNFLLVAIVILVIALAAVAAYIYTTESNPVAKIAENITGNNTTAVDVVDTNDTNNTTVVGDNSTRVNETTNVTNANTTYKVYNPQSDSYVPVIGEKFDSEVNRWYTYDEDGVRYYNTRIN